MAVDAVLAIIVIWKGWRWSPRPARSRDAALPVHRSAFFGANLLKLFTGGYVPVMLAVGADPADVDLGEGHHDPVREDAQDRRAARRARRHAGEEPAAPGQGHGRVPDERSRRRRPRRSCTTSSTTRCCTRRTSILTVRTVDVPRVDEDERVRIEQIGDSFWRVEMTYGYMETPNIPRGLAHPAQAGLQVRHHGDVVLPVPPLDPARRRIPACRSGRTSSSSVSPRPPATPRTSSRSRPAGSSRSGTQVTV